MERKIKSFTDLIAWKEAHRLVLEIYKVTDSFPRKELYSLVDQMRRSAISVTSNIAEGFSRRGQKEKLQFYFTAKGSLTELQNQLLIARDVRYLERSDFDVIAVQTVHAVKLINGLIRSVKKYQILNTNS